MNEVILPSELTPQDRLRAFQEDLRALDELAKTVHQKAIDGDNAAGHLDLKIRERRAAMFGYDNPRSIDVTLIAGQRQRSTAEALKRALTRMCADGQLSEATRQKIEPFGLLPPADADAGVALETESAAAE